MLLANALASAVLALGVAPPAHAEEGVAPPAHAEEEQVSAEAAIPTAQLTGQAFGSSVRLLHATLPVIRSDPSAMQTLPCSFGSDPVTRTNSVAQVDAPALPDGRRTLSLGAVENTGTALRSSDVADVQEQAQTGRVDLLGGVVQADAVTVRSHTTMTADAVDKHTSKDEIGNADGSSGVEIVGLRINGTPVPMDSSPEPDTIIPLPGLGYLAINEQSLLWPKVTVSSGDRHHSGLRVRGLRLHLDNVAGYTGDIIVGQAISRIVPAAAALRGHAFAAQLQVDPAATTGRQSIVHLPCQGTDGKDREFFGAGVVVQNPNGSGPLMTSGTTRGTVNGSLTPPIGSRSSETVQALSLLDDRVRATAVVARASTELAGNQVESTGSAELAGLEIDGTARSASPPPNTVVPLDGIGHLVLNEQVCVSGGGGSSCTHSRRNDITVTALKLVVTVPDNPTGLPVGAQLRVAVARTGVTRS